jgi:hypothetical protein
MNSITARTITAKLPHATSHLALWLDCRIAPLRASWGGCFGGRELAPPHSIRLLNVLITQFLGPVCAENLDPDLMMKPAE